MSVVGKYRYHMYSPAEHDRAPVVVDIILVGRTKIITLHSGIWLENRMDRKVAFRLHVPITPLVAPGRRLDERQRDSDDTIGPLKPGSGTVLERSTVPVSILLPTPGNQCPCLVHASGTMRALSERLSRARILSQRYAQGCICP